MTTYSSAVTNNNGSSGEANNSMKATNLVRFLNDPKDFSGQVIATRSERRCIATNSKIEHNPLVWLKKLERLRDLARLSDKDLLLIAADHLVGKAEIWFDITCSTILSWSEFTAIFKKKYCTGLEDIWWSYIYNKKQQENESVEDVDIELRELYSLVGLKDEHIMIRHFMDAIHKAIAWEVERKSDIGTNSSLEDIVEAAIKAESVMKKYDVKYSHRHETRQGQLPEEYDSMDMDLLPSPSLTPKDGSAPSETSSAVKMDKLLEEFNELKISMLKIQSNNNRTNQYHHNASSGPSAPAQDSLYPRSQVCFYCNQPGHIKTNCEQFKAHLAERHHQTYPATGANTEPIGEPSGKGKDRQL